LAIQGRAVYISLGCVSCHTQQVRPAGQGSDIARGYGTRPSVARDYSQQAQVLLGDRRIGPDLANYGARAKDLASVHAAIQHNGQFVFLYSGAKNEVASERAIALAAYLQSLRQDYTSPEAKLKQ
jgi:cytochrome c oxidase cbb3-type subunit 2